MQDLVNILYECMPPEGVNISAPLRNVSVPLFDSVLVPSSITYEELRRTLVLQPDYYFGYAELMDNISIQRVVPFVSQGEEVEEEMYIPLNTFCCRSDTSDDESKRMNDNKENLMPRLKRRVEEEEEEEEPRIRMTTFR